MILLLYSSPVDQSSRSWNQNELRKHPEEDRVLDEAVPGDIGRLLDQEAQRLVESRLLVRREPVPELLQLVRKLRVLRHRVFHDFTPLHEALVQRPVGGLETDSYGRDPSQGSVHERQYEVDQRLV